jgi:sporulation protein YlmC with PRC-barrel domain
MAASVLIRTVLCVMAAEAVAPALGQQSPFRVPPGPGSTPPPGEIRESPLPGSKGLYIVEQPGNTLLATEYIGRPVHGPGGERVGTVSNLLVDTTGRITGVVLEVGGVLGLGTKETAIAFEAVYPIMENGREMLVVEMNRDQLAAAPAFKRSR